MEKRSFDLGDVAARALGVAAVCAGIGAGSPGGESPALDFEWVAPEECPDKGRVIAEIERLTGRAASSGGEPALHVRAVVSRAEHGMGVVITSDQEGAPHDRRLEVAGCKEAVEATALVVAMALDPGVTGPASPEETPAPAAKAEAHEQASPAGTGSPVTVPSTGVGKRSIDVQGEARVSFAFDTAALPSPAPGIAGSLGVWLGSFRLDATGMVLAEQRRTLGDGGGGDVGLATGALGAWFAPVRGRLTALFGAAIEGGAMWGHGFGVTGARSETAPWLAVLAGAGGGVSFAPWVGAHLLACVAVPLVRERFLLGHEELFTPGPAALRLTAGIFFRAP